MKKLFLVTYLLFSSFTLPASAHCEIPCGIYDDKARFQEMLEHSETIKKSMQEIAKIKQVKQIDYHALTRWTINKEEHATKIQKIIAQYFLTQRIKIPAAEASKQDQQNYNTQLALAQQILVKAMKTKQVTNLDSVNNLRAALEKYQQYYFKQHGHKH